MSNPARPLKSLLYLVCFITAVNLVHSAQVRRPLPRPESPVQHLPEWNSGQSIEGKQYVFFDSKTSEYVVRFPEGLNAGEPDNGRSVVFRFSPEYLVEPTVRVSLRTLSDGRVSYEYRLSNAPTAPAPIRMFSLIVGSDDAPIKLSHPNWVSAGSVPTGQHVAPQAALYSGNDLREPSNMGRFLIWMSSDRGQPVDPGMEVTGFRVEASRLPGVTTAYTGTLKTRRGSVPIPPAVADQMQPLVLPEDNYKSSATIGPKYSVDATDPKQVQSVIQAFRDDVQRLVARNVLSPDSPYIRELLQTLKTPAIRWRPPVSAPQTPLEQEIASAAKITCNIGNSH